MHKTPLTCVVPSVNEVDYDAGPIGQFLASGASSEIYPQFVYLINSKSPPMSPEATVTQFANHEIVRVPSDRYFGTCEENIYRSHDFTEIFSPHIILAGDRDIIDWGLLIKALVFAKNHKIDVLAWNFLRKELRPDGNFAEIREFICNTQASASMKYLNRMLDGEILDMDVGYPALLSNQGVIDYTSYFGVHLYSREAYKRIMAYPTYETLYSIVYKPLIIAEESKLRYGFFNETVLHNIRDSYWTNQSEDTSIKWSEKHRTVKGHCRTFWISNLYYLSLLENPETFHMMTNSLRIPIVPSEDYSLKYQCGAMLLDIFGWIGDVINEQIFGTSYYLPSVKKNSMSDLFYIKKFLVRLVEGFGQYEEIYRILGAEAQLLIRNSISLITEYVKTAGSPDSILTLSAQQVSETKRFLSPEKLFEMNNLAFEIFISERSRRH